MVDALAPEGIEIDVEKQMSANIGVSLEPGLQRLNGQELLGYSLALKQPETVETLTVPVENSYTNERYDGIGLALDIDFEQNTEAIQAFLDGEPASVETGTTAE
ncbi:Regulatory protein msrR [Mycobacteroides abscessus subsp. abscessus]|nr:Regulatory protein msrR [Mycobacteroides abscessus subsp. abscessus]